MKYHVQTSIKIRNEKIETNTFLDNGYVLSKMGKIKIVKIVQARILERHPKAPNTKKIMRCLFFPDLK